MFDLECHFLQFFFWNLCIHESSKHWEHCSRSNLVRRFKPWENSNPGDTGLKPGLFKFFQFISRGWLSNQLSWDVTYCFSLYKVVVYKSIWDVSVYLKWLIIKSIELRCYSLYRVVDYKINWVEMLRFISNCWL